MPYLRQVLLSERQDAKDLVHYCIDWLGWNITDSNKQSIIDFVWNLTQIDPDNPLLLPHGDRVLARLTEISSSMMDSTSLISVSVHVHEFDHLFLLGRRPANTAPTEQLCSIFFRLLRQNVLSNKKKRSAEHDLTYWILKVQQDLIIHVSDLSEKYRSWLPILLCRNSQRIELVKLFQTLVGPSNSRIAWYL